MAPFAVRKTDNLRRGRVSLPGARYFVTMCVAGRQPVLSQAANAPRVFTAFDRLSGSGDWVLLAATIMPDHVHVLFRLGARLSLDRTMAKLKTVGRDVRCAWSWPANGFEHQLHEAEEVEDYAFYIFMNPYRAKIVSTKERWALVARRRACVAIRGKASRWLPAAGVARRG